LPITSQEDQHEREEVNERTRRQTLLETGVERFEQERLAPGELDKLVLGFMRRNKKDAPHTPSAVAKGIKRSSGAVANCLGRQDKAKKVRLVSPKPRRYELVEAKKK
jgi:hypothetical protein